MGSEHKHGDHAPPKVTQNNERIILAALTLTFTVMVVEAAGAYVSGSLALLADAGHMLMDTFALMLAWLGFRFGRMAIDSRRTYGYRRFEVLAGLLNALLLFAVMGWIFVHAVQRVFRPAEIHAAPMFVVAALGLIANLAVLFLLRRADTEHVNIRGAMVHVLGDLLGSVGALLGALLIAWTGWTPIDSILSVLLGTLILRSAWLLVKDSLNILMEGAPPGLEPEKIRSHLLSAVPGLLEAKHIHVWSITSGRVAATLEVQMEAGRSLNWTLQRIKEELQSEFGIDHSTVEISENEL